MMCITNVQKYRELSQRENPTSGSRDPKPIVPQTNYHTLATIGFQLSELSSSAVTYASV